MWGKSTAFVPKQHWWHCQQLMSLWPVAACMHGSWSKHLGHKYCVCVRERERERDRQRVRVKEVITSNTQNYWSTLRPLFHYYDPRLLGYTLRWYIFFKTVRHTLTVPCMLHRGLNASYDMIGPGLDDEDMFSYPAGYLHQTVIQLKCNWHILYI